VGYGSDRCGMASVGEVAGPGCQTKRDGGERLRSFAGPSEEAGSEKRATRLLGCEEGEEQAFEQEGEGPG